MKILLVHTFYQQPGGEDQVFLDESRLLEAHGHEVVRYTMHNCEMKRMGGLEVARRTIWNGKAYRELRGLIRAERPAVMHCHNTFPLISPAAYYAAGAERVPVVQTLHNFRLLCVSGVMTCEQAVCEGKIKLCTAWRGIWRGCYRNSRTASGVVAAKQLIHCAIGTWNKRVDRYVVLSQHATEVFIAGGLPAEKLSLKRNFVAPDPGVGTGAGGYALFAGRLSKEKGVNTMLRAWQRWRQPQRLLICGDGPMANEVREFARKDSRIKWLGHQPNDEVVRLVGEARYLLVPSVWAENCPKTVLEAFARGTPVIASRIGALAEMVDHGRTGLVFNLGDPDDLAAKLAELNSDPARLADMRQAARAEFEAQYSAEANYRTLMAIYNQTAGGRLVRDRPPANALAAR